jgi:Family of unknown function (DUF5522)
MSKRQPLVEGRDYTLDQRGRFVFTREFLAGRGECCGSTCTNCPYGNSPADRSRAECMPAGGEAAGLRASTTPASATRVA